MRSFTFISASALALSATPTLGQSTPPTIDRPTECAATTGDCSVVDQSGTDGKVTVSQQGGGNAAGVDQSGDRGNVEVTQDGSNNTALVNQAGSGTNPVPDYGDGYLSQVAIIDQEGTGNRARIDQNDENAAGAAFPRSGQGMSNSDSYAGIWQDGQNNTAAIEQSGFYQIAYVEQIDGASGNVSTTAQTGSYQYATTRQTGAGNDSSITQSDGGAGPGLSGGVGNNVYDESEEFAAGVDQSGDRNVSEIGQSGQSNFAMVDQEGNDNRSEITQSGVGSTAIVAQYSNDNLSTINQRGTGVHTATVTQGAPGGGN